MWVAGSAMACDVTIGVTQLDGQRAPYRVSSFRGEDRVERAGRFQGLWSGTIPCGRYEYRLERVQPRAEALDIGGEVTVFTSSQWESVNPSPTLDVMPNGQLVAMDRAPLRTEGPTLVFEGIRKTEQARWVRVAEAFGDRVGAYKLGPDGTVVLSNRHSSISVISVMEERTVIYVGVVDFRKDRRRVVIRVGGERVGAGQ